MVVWAGVLESQSAPAGKPPDKERGANKSKHANEFGFENLTERGTKRS